MWGDFKDYMKDNDTFYVQMDCVEGKKTESATLLTLHWPVLRMQLAFLMEKQDSAHVVAMLDKLEETLGTDLFRLTFPLILTDNGQEFSDISGMERSCFDPGRKRTMIFFCEPNRSQPVNKPSRRIKAYETDYIDLVTWCDSVCMSCDECPKYISDCNGDRSRQLWSDVDGYLQDVTAVMMAAKQRDFQG